MAFHYQVACPISMLFDIVVSIKDMFTKRRRVMRELLPGRNMAAAAILRAVRIDK